MPAGRRKVHATLFTPPREPGEQKNKPTFSHPETQEILQEARSKERRTKDLLRQVKINGMAGVVVPPQLVSKLRYGEKYLGEHFFQDIFEDRRKKGKN